MFNVCSKTAWLFQARNYCAPLCSNVKSKILCQVFLFQARNCYLWHLMSRVKGHHSLKWRATGDRYTTLMFPDSGQCAYLVQWCTVPRISMSIVCNQYSMSRYQLVSVHSMARPCLGLLAALLTSMFAESFYVLSSLCFASSLELTILGWHYFGSGTVSRINDRSFYLIPLLQKNIASWAQWR